MKLRNKLEDYTEAEFEDLLTIVFNYTCDSEDAYHELVAEIDRITEHPKRNEILFYPAPDAEDSPKGVINTIKTWRAANGKPGFKPPQD